MIQLRPGGGESRRDVAGRVEHLASGEAARFRCEDELWVFVDGVLTTLTEGPVSEDGRR